MRLCLREKETEKWNYLREEGNRRANKFPGSDDIMIGLLFQAQFKQSLIRQNNQELERSSRVEVGSEFTVALPTASDIVLCSPNHPGAIYNKFNNMKQSTMYLLRAVCTVKQQARRKNIYMNTHTEPFLIYLGWIDHWVIVPWGFLSCLSTGPGGKACISSLWNVGQTWAKRFGAARWALSDRGDFQIGVSHGLSDKGVDFTVLCPWLPLV